MDISTTNMIGHGSELSFRAINMELIVRMILPMAPIIIPLTVSCLSVILILISFCNYKKIPNYRQGHN